MTNWSRPSNGSVQPALVALLALGWIAVTLFVYQQVLILGLLPLGVVGCVYVLCRVVPAVEGIADALQRIARQMEEE